MRPVLGFRFGVCDYSGETDGYILLGSTGFDRIWILRCRVLPDDGLIRNALPVWKTRRSLRHLCHLLGISLGWRGLGDAPDL